MEIEKKFDVYLIIEGKDTIKSKENGAENFLELMKNKPTDLKAQKIQR